ncbi:MAG: bacterial transcriptional activator domain-containing protein [Firmicutes bacterium]|nr:bacterial transcriptional activator domain-containing protein [Bacillota bacterium]
MIESLLNPPGPARPSSYYVIRQGDAYGLNLASGYWLDAEEFESLVTKANLLVDRSPAEAMDLYSRGFELYEGDYLACAPYEDWCSAERERLFSLYLRSSSRLAKMLAAAERYDECIAVAEKILTRDDCWEEAYRLLMFCHARLGSRSAAARAFERCTERLANGLSVSPMPSTVRLYQQILQHVGDRVELA